MNKILELLKGIFIGALVIVISVILSVIMRGLLILIFSILPMSGGREEIIIFISKLTNSTIMIFLPSILICFTCGIYLNKFEGKIFKKENFKVYNLIIAGLLASSMICMIVLIDVLIFKSSVVINKARYEIISLFIVFLFQSTGEELLFRSFLYNKLKINFSKGFSLMISSLLFILLHLGNPGFGLIPAINLFLFSLIASYIYESMGIGGSSIFHCLWNYTQISIFSIPVSGMIEGDIGIFKLINSNINLGFGLEGSFITIIVQIFVILLIIALKSKYKIKKLMA